MVINLLTGLKTVRPPATRSRRDDIGLMLLALVLGVATIGAAFAAIASPSGRVFAFSGTAKAVPHVGHDCEDVRTAAAG